MLIGLNMLCNYLVVKIVVVGGGVLGFVMVYVLYECSRDVNQFNEIIVFEVGEVIGGIIVMILDNGFLCEGGFNGFLDSKLYILLLIWWLGLSEQVLIVSDVVCWCFVMIKGRLYEFPIIFGAFFCSGLFMLGGWLWVVGEWWVGCVIDVDEMVVVFVCCWLGTQVVQCLIDLFVSGVFVGDFE